MLLNCVVIHIHIIVDIHIIVMLLTKMNNITWNCGLLRANTHQAMVISSFNYRFMVMST